MFKLTSLLLEQNSKPKVLFVGNYQLSNVGSFAKQLIKNNNITGNIISKYKPTVDYIKNRVDKYFNENAYDSMILLIHPYDFGVSDIKLKSDDVSPSYSYAISLAKQNNVDITIVMISSLYTTKQEIEKMNSWVSSTGVGNILNFTKVFKTAKNFSDTYNLSRSSNNQIKSALISNITALQSISIQPVTKDDKPKSDDADIDIDDNDTKTTDAPGNKSKSKSKPKNVRSFIEEFKHIAISHQQKYGIPASITLAQAALESSWGGSYLASSGNNYFGIKCHSWSGDKIYADDDAKGECFRKYDSPEQSFEDHALFLKQNSRYKSLFKTKDYLEWAYGLQSAGYATSQSYATSLINLIETYDLNAYDTQNIDTDKEPESTKLTNLISKKLNVYSSFGMRKRGMHYGIDYSPMPVGSKIYINMPGTVIKAGNIDPDGWGNTVMITHDDGTTTLYAHLSSVDVEKGDTLDSGTLIGKTGGALGTPGRGNSEGAHLHWEYHPGGYVGKSSAADGESVADKYFKIV